LLSVYYVRCYLVYIYSMLWPFSLEIDDGLSLARQYGGRGGIIDTAAGRVRDVIFYVIFLE